MKNERFERQIRLFGYEGQEKISQTRVCVVGIGGIGTHLVQQLSLIGVRHFGLIDSEDIDETNRNRYIGLRYDDPIPGLRKVDLGERIAKAIDPEARVSKVHDSFVSAKGFDELKSSTFVFGCVDLEGARLVLNEVCSAYDKTYFDLATEVMEGEPILYGGRICFSKGDGCIICRDMIDIAEAQVDLLNPKARTDREAIYGVDRGALGRTGPSVVSINGVIASLCVTEFMVEVTGLRRAHNVLNYYGHTGKVTIPANPPHDDCYYCKEIRGKGEAVDVFRYVRERVGEYLR